MCVCVLLECDKAICLNELGRMMSWYGDREYSVTFFRKSLDIVMEMLQDRTLIQEERLNTLNPRLVMFMYITIVMCINWIYVHRYRPVHLP